MSLAEDPGTIGPINKEWYRYLWENGGSKTEDSGGSSVQKSNPDADAFFVAAQIDELVGKIGPELTAYNPEATNRLIQDF